MLWQQMMFLNKPLTHVFFSSATSPSRIPATCHNTQEYTWASNHTSKHQQFSSNICMPFGKFLNSFLFFSPGVRFVSESSRSFLTSNSTSGLTQGTNLTSAGTRDAPSSSLSCPTYSHTPGPATMTINCTHRISLKNNSFNSCLSIQTMSFQYQLKTS